MSNAFAPIVRARPNPIFGRPVHQGPPPIDYSPILLLKPFGFRIAPDTLSSDENLVGQRGITPAFGYSAPHPSAGGTLTLLIHALPSAHYGPLRHPSAPGLSLTGVRLIIPDHTVGLPVLRALSLCTCCRQYPGAAAGRNPRSSHPAVAAFPDSAVGSACTSTFSRLARRSLALRPAHSRGHQVVTAIRRLQPFRYLHDCSDCFRLERIAGWALHPLESAALSRRTPIPVIGLIARRWPRRSFFERGGSSRWTPTRTD